MDKRVYLHEFDCSMMSENETYMAQKKLYEELVLNGNIVVLSFFEVLDSPAFFRLYSVYKDEILSLFKNGRIKINFYGSNYTPLQCILEKIRVSIKDRDKALNNNNSSKITDLFAVLDNKLLETKVILKDEYIKEESDKKVVTILDVLAKALEFNDSNIFNRYILFESKLDFNAQKLSDYVDMVISITSIKNIFVPTKDDKNVKSNFISLKDLFNKIYNYEEKIYNYELYPVFNNLKVIYDLIAKIEQNTNLSESEKTATKLLNTREEWYKKLSYGNPHDKVEELTYKSRTVIDVLYNMVVESSIPSIDKRDLYSKAKEEKLYEEFISKYKLHLFDINNRVKAIQDYNNVVLVYKNKKHLEDFKYAAYIFEVKTKLKKQPNLSTWYATKVIICLKGLFKSFAALGLFLIVQIGINFILEVNDLLPPIESYIASLFGSIILGWIFSPLIEKFFERVGVSDDALKHVFKSFTYLFKSIFNK